MAASIPKHVARRPLSANVFVHRRFSLSQSQSFGYSILHPESPQSVDIPQPLQPQAVELPRVKGILPRPRRIFRQSGLEKDSEEYFESVNPKRTTERPVPAEKHKEVIDYKARLTELRRKNLRDGIHQLRERKRKTDRYMRAQSLRKQKEFKEAVSKPQREDERLTLPTVVEIKQEPQGYVMSAEEVARRKERLARREAGKAEERRVNLHTLYMNARDFIVTEEQLDKKVNEVFDAPFYQNENDPSIWKEKGTPERTSDLIDKANGRSRHALDANEGYTILTSSRLQKIAEELTGGKLENPDRDAQAKKKL